MKSLDLEKEIETFNEWLKNEEIPEQSEDGKRVPADICRMKFLLVKALIIELAKEGNSRKRVWKYLKKEGRIDYVYVTFCRHLEKNDISKFFFDYKGKSLPKEETPPPIRQKADEKPTEKKPEPEIKTPSTPKSAEKYPLRFSEIHKKHADDLTNSKEETQESPKSSKPIFRPCP